MYQLLTIVGNLGRDPELRYSPSGQPVTTLSVATNNTYTNAQGEQVKETTWFRADVWGKTAEACTHYLAKGRSVLVIGRLKADAATGGPRIWNDQQGNARAAFELTAQTVKFLGGAGNAAPATADDTPDDIPFE